MKTYLFLLLSILMAFSPSHVMAAESAARTFVEGDVVKTYCSPTFAYADLDEMKAGLLINAKRQAVNEIFGELIVASAAVENFVVTGDQIRASSIGFVRVRGSVRYYNGENLAEVCASITAYVNQEDRAKFEPVRLEKRYCATDEKLSTRELRKYANEEVLVQALLDYDLKLEDVPREDLLQLIQQVEYLSSGFVPETETYCVTAAGVVVPVEAMAILLFPIAPEPDPGLAPEPGTEKEAVYVCQIGDADYSSIQTAVESVTDDAVINVCPGVYRESITITRTLSLVGMNALDPVILLAAEANAITFEVPSGRIENLTISVAPPKNEEDIFSGIAVYTGTVAIEGNDIESLAGNGIVVTGGAAPTIRSNILRNSRNNGLIVLRGSTPLVEDNTIEENGGDGVIVYASSGTYSANTVSGNTGPGIQLNSSDATVQANQLFENGWGIYVVDGGKSQITENTIYSNRDDGILISMEADPLVMGNLIYSNYYDGIEVTNGGLGEIRENRVFKNGDSGIFIRYEGTPIVEDNEFTENTDYGIEISATGHGTFIGNILTGNGTGASSISAPRGTYVWKANKE